MNSKYLLKTNQIIHNTQNCVRGILGQYYWRWGCLHTLNIEYGGLCEAGHYDDVTMVR